MLFWPGVMRTGPYLNFRCCTPGCVGAEMTVALAPELGSAEVLVSSLVEDDLVVEAVAFSSLPDEAVELSPALPQEAISTTASADAPIAAAHDRLRRRAGTDAFVLACTSDP